MGFPDRCIALPPDADEATISELCRQHTARLVAWIEQQRQGGEDGGAAGEPALPRYDGSVYSACQMYQRHPRSRFHKVKANTRKSYVDSLTIIEREVGKRLIRNLTVLDVEHWYEMWRLPTAQGENERIDRAHNAVAMFRTVLRFCAALRKSECKVLAEELKLVQFERGGAREEEMTLAQVGAFIRKVLELGRTGVIPADRALYLAIGVAAQFELLLRQKDIIGEWHASATEAGTAIAKGAVGIAAGDETWTGFFTWERIPGWRWRMRTSKSKYRAAAEFDLPKHSLLFPLLEQVPHHQRSGAIVKGEHGLPVRERSYRKWFRAVARAAGIPDEVWNMDTRAGGATEAEESGASLDAIQGALTHSKQDTTLRYIRRRTTKIADVAQARSQKRAADERGGDG
jgi:hypothetical protein